MAVEPLSGARIEAALEASLKNVADIKFALDQSTIVAITDQRGIINYVNEAFCRISKYTRQELLGQDHRIINSGFHPKEYIRNLWTTIASGKVWRGELRNRAKDGSIYWVDTTIVPFLDRDGKPYQYVAIRHDITQLKEAEEKIQQQAAELHRATQLSFVGELAAGLAHEVKNPLAGIQGAVDILIRRREPTDPELEVLTGIREQVERIDGTVRALLDRARPRSMNRQLTSLRELTSRAVNVARAQLIRRIGKKKVRIEFEPPDEDLVLSVDPASMEDAILNLVINAIEAIDDGGIVSVRLQRGEATEPENPEEAIIKVTDTGRGISQDDVSRIFNPFFTTTEGGTGLGLPAVRRIVRIHGGRIEVDSTIGKGSTFTIHLPLSAL